MQYLAEDQMTPKNAKSALRSLIRKYGTDTDASPPVFEHLTYLGYALSGDAQWKNIIGYEIYRVPATADHNGGWIANIVFRRRGHQNFMMGIPDAFPVETREDAERYLAAIAASILTAKRHKLGKAAAPPMAVIIDGQNIDIDQDVLAALHINPQRAIPLETCLAELEAGGVALSHREDAEFLAIPATCFIEGVSEAHERRAAVALTIIHSLALHGEWLIETETYRRAHFRPDASAPQMAGMRTAGNA